MSRDSWSSWKTLLRLRKALEAEDVRLVVGGLPLAASPLHCDEVWRKLLGAPFTDTCGSSDEKKKRLIKLYVYDEKVVMVQMSRFCHNCSFPFYPFCAHSQPAIATRSLLSLSLSFDSPVKL